MSNYLIIAAKGGNLGAEPLFEFMWLDYKCHNITDALFELDEWHGATCAFVCVRSLQMSATLAVGIPI